MEFIGTCINLRFGGKPIGVTLTVVIAGLALAMFRSRGRATKNGVLIDC